ncbi:MAG: nucleoside-triphosphatase [Bacteroidales bacterium]
MLTGPVGGGKSNLAAVLAAALQKKGHSVAGILCPSRIRDGIRIGYDLQLLPSDERTPFVRNHPEPGWQSFRRFYFHPEGFLRGTEETLRAVNDRPDLIILDEVGPLELEGKGWADLVKALSSRNETTQLWLCRDSLWEEIARLHDVVDGRIHFLDQTNVVDLMDKLGFTYEPENPLNP